MNLKEYQKEINNLEHTINILSWDLLTSTPIDAQDNQISLITNLESKLFKLKISPEYGKLLKRYINSKKFLNKSEFEQRIINNIYKDYLKNLKIPQEFYERYVKLKHICTKVWEEAKNKNDYNLFKPYLEKIIEYTKEYYSYLSDKDNLYDLMLDSFEEGLTSSIIDELFEELKIKLIPLIKKQNNHINNTKIKINKEKYFDAAEYLLNYIGFDLEKGALGIYPHPFTEKVGDNDVRIAFNWTDNPFHFVTTIIHEGGHGILEQNTLLSKYGCISYDGINALHESQSRFYENILGRNINFWVPIYNDIKKILGIKMDINEFLKGLNNPYPNLIRTQSDELTYCMHIILRYEIERDLFNNTLSVDKLPIVWNQKMEEYLGIRVTDDKDGILQDVHWASGEFGYFPSYLVGSIFDGMFLKAIERDLGNIDEILSKGNIKDITNYLIEHIYLNAGAYTGIEVLKNLGFEKISVDPLVNYFKDKYGDKL